jgi:hypothetical protein
MRTIQTAMAALLGAALGSGAVWYLYRQPPGAVAAPASASAAAVAPSSHPIVTANAIPAGKTATVQAKTQGKLLEDDLAPLATVDVPAAALAMFSLIESCVEFQRNETRKFDQASHEMRELTDPERRDKTGYCAHMTEALKRERLAYLDKAVKGGAMGAAVAFVTAGPFGDPSALQTRPDDALVRDWKTRAAGHLADASHQGDITAILYLGTTLGSPDTAGSSPLLRHAAALAAGRILATFGGADGLNPYSEESLPATKTMSREQLAAARALADDLEAAYRERKQREITGR